MLFRQCPFSLALTVMHIYTPVIHLVMEGKRDLQPMNPLVHLPYMPPNPSLDNLRKSRHLVGFI